MMEFSFFFYYLFNWTPLSCAVSEGYADIVKLLIEINDVDINIQGNDGIYLFVLTVDSNA